MDGYALIDIPRCGAENMALDQRLLEFAAEQQRPVLRLYRWSEPTLSLGYFQHYAERVTHPPSSQLAVVRRSTGGGAIVHHADWTYCVALPDQALANDSGRRAIAASKIGASQPLYDCLHDAVVLWLQGRGLAAKKWSATCDTPPTQPPGQHSPEQSAVEQAVLGGAASKRRFLCFERRSCGDVVSGQHKVMGSAQRRRPGALLQHGSLLLATSEYAPSLSGLAELSPALDAAMAAPGQLESFFLCLKNGIQATTGTELRDVDSINALPLGWSWPRQTPYADSSWTRRR
ncbi:MAG: hypothetical protein KDA45_14205 [Planctomycetales bacterium]|nr:hypothetical protein [Planctomycetales bacterium]